MGLSATLFVAALFFVSFGLKGMTVELAKDTMPSPAMRTFAITLLSGVLFFLLYVVSP